MLDLIGHLVVLLIQGLLGLFQGRLGAAGLVQLLVELLGLYLVLLAGFLDLTSRNGNGSLKTFIGGQNIDVTRL